MVSQRLSTVRRAALRRWALSQRKRSRWVEVRVVKGKVKQDGARSFNCLPPIRALVAARIVHHDDFAGPQFRDQCLGGRRTPREHDGRVVAIRSNVRWCSNALKSTCWNGAIVRFAFAIGCHDREVIGWLTTTAVFLRSDDPGYDGIAWRGVRYRPPHRVPWLRDKESIFAAHKRVETAMAFNLEPCFTPVESTGRSGMAETFVKTLERDYVRIAALPDADTALVLIES